MGIDLDRRRAPAARRIAAMRRLPAAFVVALGLWTAPATAQQKPLDEAAAQKLLIDRIAQDRLYAQWTTFSCLTFYTEAATTRYFDFAVRETHGGQCPGERAEPSILDRFRVERGTRTIQWYDAKESDYVPYSRAPKRKR